MVANLTHTYFRRYIVKLTKSTIAATFAALLIGGLSISPASAKSENGRVPTATHAGFELKGDSTYNSGRSAPESSQPILRSPSMKSNERGRTNGRTG